MVRKREVDHYDEICKLVIDSVSSALPSDWRCAIVNNQSCPNLRQQIKNLCAQLKIQDLSLDFPIVLPDIVLGICDPQGRLRLAMFEVKGPANSMSLTDYSQMIGYLQSAEKINIGVLLLIESRSTEAPTSTDLQRVIDGGWLLANWTCISNMSGRSHKYRSGITWYSPGGNIEWASLAPVGGISNWSEFLTELTTSSPVG
jgi:hypothetical protein